MLTLSTGQVTRLGWILQMLFGNTRGSAPVSLCGPHILTPTSATSWGRDLTFYLLLISVCLPPQPPPHEPQPPPQPEKEKAMLVFFIWTDLIWSELNWSELNWSDNIFIQNGTNCVEYIKTIGTAYCHSVPGKTLTTTAATSPTKQKDQEHHPRMIKTLSHPQPPQPAPAISPPEQQPAASPPPQLCLMWELLGRLWYSCQPQAYSRTQSLLSSYTGFTFLLPLLDTASSTLGGRGWTSR